MEFRDYVAAGTLVLGATSFVYNWWSARGWRQKVQVRDELFRFARDEDVKATVTQESTSAAHDAAVYLSIEIAENARRAAARRAKRTGAAFRRDAGWGGFFLGVLYVLIIVGTITGWNANAADNIVTTIYFIVIGVAAGVFYGLYLRDGLRARSSLPKLKELRSKVAKGESLLAKDLRQHVPPMTG